MTSPEALQQQVAILHQQFPVESRRLLALIKEHSFRRGKFILASGKEANYYIDCRMTTLHAEGSLLIGKLLYELLAPLGIDAVGGMSMGADPIVTAITSHSARVGNPIHGFLIRKEAKGHGRGRQVEGHLEPWMRVALVEDVVTTGGSTLKAIAAVQAQCDHPCNGAQIVRIASLVDRLEAGQDAFSKIAIAYQSLYTVRELLAE